MDFAQTLFGLIANPNVAYILLILGLLSLVIAIATPGTGLVEVTAVVCLILALLGLSQLPVNLAGVLLILLGVGLFVADIKLQSGMVAIGGALALGVGSLFLFKPSAQAVTVSWWLIALVTIGSVALFGLGVNRALHAMRLPIKGGADQLVGERGVITSPLLDVNNRVGAAQIGGELWSVTSEAPLAAGAEVIVEEVEGLVLKVRPK